MTLYLMLHAPDLGNAPLHTVIPPIRGLAASSFSFTFSGFVILVSAI